MLKTLILSTKYLQRDITAGGVDVVPASLFANADYAALGHIHRLRAILGKIVRYSGAPIHLTFGEATQPRGGCGSWT